MKTTIDIADNLFERARERAQTRGTTFRALVEEGLRAVLDRPLEEPVRFEMITWGDPDNPDDPEELRKAIEEAREGRSFPELEDLR